MSFSLESYCYSLPNTGFTGILLLLLLLLTQYWFHWNPTATPCPILVSLESYCYSLLNTGFTGILLTFALFPLLEPVQYPFIGIILLQGTPGLGLILMG